eukprot:gene31225-37736_t
MATLTIQTILNLTYISPFIPRGLVYAFPFVIQFLAKFAPVLRSNYPILPVRIAECFVGKVSPVRMLILIPAHMLGAIFGTLALKSFIPFLPNSVLTPINYSNSSSLSGLLYEVVLSFCYCLVLLVLPYIYDRNRYRQQYFISLPILPLLFIRTPAYTSTLNPSVVYALWYINNCGSLVNYSRTLPWDRILGPILGAVGAGVVCNMYFPDDPKSWTRAQVRSL